MQNPDISRNLNKLIALSLLMLVVATPISVLAVDNFNYYTNPYEYRKSSDVNYGDPRDLGEAITIEVAGYEPAAVKSSQIESTELPIYVFLKGITLGSLFGMDVETEPFISQPKIRSITITQSGQSSQYVRGIQYTQPRRNALNLDNLGVVTVILKQIKDETKVPEEITLNLSAKIYFDFMRGFGGISSSDLLLREANEEKWKKDYANKNSFWNGKGYLRLIDVSNNEAKIQVYGSGMSLLSNLFASDEEAAELQRFNERGVLALSPGEVRTITLPGTSAFFRDQVRIKLNKIADVSKEARLKISGSDGISYNSVGEGMSISSGSNWRVYQINVEECPVGQTKCSDGICRADCGGGTKTSSITNIKPTRMQIANGLVTRGFTKEEAAAITGNIYVESGFNPEAVNLKSGAYGLMQWLGQRKENLEIFAIENEKDKSDVNLQLDFIRYELTFGDAYEISQFEKAMKYGNTIALKTEGFAKEVERASAQELKSSMQKRIGMAEVIYAQLNPTTPTAAAATGFAVAAPKTGTSSVVLKNSVGEKVTLNLKQGKKQENVITITDANIEENKNKVCKENNVITDDNLISELLNKESEEEKRDNAIKLYCTAISRYEQAITEDVKIRDQTYKGIAKSYTSISDFTEENRQTARSLALYYYKKISDVTSMYSEIKELEDKLYTNVQSDSVYLEDEDIRVSLLDVELHAEDRTSAVISVNGQDQTFYEGNNIITEKQGNTDVVWRISRIDSESVQLKKYEDGASKGKATLYYGKQVSVDTHNLILRSVDSKRSAYVTVMPGGGDVYSESSFKVHIPIEKRLIQWTPEQIDKMIEETTKQIEILDRYITQLNSMITSWKYVCFATFTLLTIKNSFISGADRNRARKDVMPYYNQKCETEVVVGTEGSKTFDKCMNIKYADEIENDLTQVEKVQQKILDCKKAKYTSTNANGCSIEKYYPTTYNEKIEKLGFINKISQEEFEQAQKCKLYGELNEISANLKEQVTDNCVNIEKDIAAKQNAMDEAISAAGNIPEEKATAQQKTEYLNKLESNYRASSLYEIRYADSDKINEDLKELNNKISALGIDGLTSLNKNNLAMEALSDTSKPNENKYTLITVKENQQGTLDIKDSFDYIPITDYHATKTEAVTQYNKDCPDAQKNRADCIQKLSKLNQPLTITTRQGNEYRFFKGKENGQDKYFAALETVELTEAGTNKEYSKDARAQYDADGRPYCIPTGKDGNYVKMLSWYATGDPDDCELWNVGADGKPCEGSDLLIEDKLRLSSKSRGECVNIARQAGKCTEPGKQVRIGTMNLICDQTAYKIAQIGQGTHCQDVMDPSDCKQLFAVCDPVMCPPSRFNLGGRWPLPRGTVVDTGIIGSIVLGLPNFPEVPVPVCLPGILAGLRNIKQLLSGFKECLIAAKINHENIGICDKIRSVGICELFWREVINIFKLRGSLSSIIYEKAYGAVEGDGGEYLNFNQQIDSVSNSVKYFTSEYGSSAFAAFKGRSTEEIGTVACKAAIYGKFGDVGDFVNQLAQPENPPQFTAYFDESVWSVSAGKTYSTKFGPQSPEQSIYSVHYFIYAGNIPDLAKTGYAREGIKYAVFLRDDFGNALPVTVRNSNQLYDTIPYDSHKDVSLEKLGPREMNKICVFINGRENCGYGKVTTEFSLNYLNDRIVASDALSKKIDSMEECISEVPRVSTSLGSAVLPREYGLLSTGVVRTCSVLNPGEGSGESQHWGDVGSCGLDKQKNNLGKCWLDKRTIDIKDTQKMQEVKTQLINLDAYNKMDDEQKKIFMEKYYTPEKSKLYYDALETKRSSIKGQTEFKDLLTEGVKVTDEISAKYRDLADYSLDPRYKVLSQLALGEIYFRLAESINPEKVVEKEGTASVGGEKQLSEEESKKINEELYCSGFTDIGDCNTLDNQDICFWDYSTNLCKPKSLLPKEKVSKDWTINLDLTQKSTEHINLEGFDDFYIQLKSISETGFPSAENELTFSIQTTCGNFDLEYDNIKHVGKEKEIYCAGKNIIIKVDSGSQQSATFSVEVLGALKCEECGKNLLGSELLGLLKPCFEGECHSLGDCTLNAGDCLKCPSTSSECQKLNEYGCGQCSSCEWKNSITQCRLKSEKIYWFKTFTNINPKAILNLFLKTRDLERTNEFINLNLNAYDSNKKLFPQSTCILIPITDGEYNQLSNLKNTLKTTLEECKSK